MYHSVIKDRLIKVKNYYTNEIIQEITYSNTDSFKPTNMIIKGQNKQLTWEGRRLKQIGNNIHYTYNANGIRIEKETEEELTTYKTEGNKIIIMEKSVEEEDVKLEFIYDANGNLIGVNTEEGNYFYIRDIMGNIVNH